MATTAEDARGYGLLPSALGHVTRGSAVPGVPADAVEAFSERVAAALARTVATGLEHGFLAYLPASPGGPLHAEDESVGTPHEIRWHWREHDSAVAFSFHTHPGRRANRKPSGVDLVGAIIRGDHIMYILTEDGRLSGWRFRDPKGHPRAIEDALRAIADQGRLGEPIVRLLYDASKAMRARLVEQCYQGRVVDGRIVSEPFSR